MDGKVERGQFGCGAFLTEGSSTDQRLRENRPVGEDVRANALERAVQRGAGIQTNFTELCAANGKVVRGLSGERREVLQTIVGRGAGALN